MARCTYRVDSLTLTGDDIYGRRICRQGFIDYAWLGHGFNFDYWQGGWGFNDCCNIRKPLARAFNPIWLLGYSAQDWANESWDAPMLNWAPRYVREQFSWFDDLRAMCGDGAVAEATGCHWTRSFTEWSCVKWGSHQLRTCAGWHWLFRWLCLLYTLVVTGFCLIWGWVSTFFCTLYYWAADGGEHFTLYLKFFYTLDNKQVMDVVVRAGTLVHEARHTAGKPHDGVFPPGSRYGAGEGADSSWGYEGAWMFETLYYWWFYEEGVRTSLALRESAKAAGNLNLANAFTAPPGYVIS